MWSVFKRVLDLKFPTEKDLGAEVRTRPNLRVVGATVGAVGLGALMFPDVAVDVASALAPQVSKSTELTFIEGVDDSYLSRICHKIGEVFFDLTPHKLHNVSSANGGAYYDPILTPQYVLGRIVGHAIDAGVALGIVYKVDKKYNLGLLSGATDEESSDNYDREYYSEEDLTDYENGDTMDYGKYF